MNKVMKYLVGKVRGYFPLNGNFSSVPQDTGAGCSLNGG